MISVDDYFLSDRNPVANTDQCAFEEKALELIKRPEVVQAKAFAAHLWRNVCQYPDRDQMDRFDDMIDEYVFHHALRAANSDPTRPGVVRYFSPPYSWFGREVPGSRWAGESPDVVYRMMPLAPGGRYELRGTASCERPPMAVYSLMSDNTAVPFTQKMLDSMDMEIEANGDFVITLDASPANGRPNHIQTFPDTDHLWTRDVLGDWLTQTANGLRIHRLDSGPGAELGDEELAKRAVRTLTDNIYFNIYCARSGSNMPPNEIRPPVSAALTAGLSNQIGVKGNVELRDDEALIITANTAGAIFRNAILLDAFSLTMDYGHRTHSLNMTQMAPDEDGLFTFVVAHEDPGVHNWLDTGGLSRTMFGHRWQSFPKGQDREQPHMTMHKVKFAELSAVLPAGIAGIDAAGRASQLSRRAAGYAMRFLDK